MPIVACVLVIVASGGYFSVARNESHVFSNKFAFLGVKPSQTDVQEVKKQKFVFLGMKPSLAGLRQDERLPANLAVRLHYWEYYAKNIMSGWKEFLLGHAKRPDRAKYPSAHNYYLDFVFNFGVLAILPLLALIGYTVLMVYLGWKPILASSSLLGLTLVVILLVFVDNSFKVGLRQPYSGILTFFLWGVLLSRLSESSGMARHNVTA